MYSLITKVKQLYWFVVPYNIRIKIENKKNEKLRNHLLQELEKRAEEDVEFGKIQKYLQCNPVAVYNYSFTKKYVLKDFYKYIMRDKENGLNYALHNGKRLYIKSKYNTISTAARYYRGICTEQDIESPHKYTSEKFAVTKGGILLDIGAAEGFFALDYVDDFDIVYIVEGDNDWIKALKVTFRDYIQSGKVVIIPKLAGNMDDEQFMTVDKLLENLPVIDKLTIKMDVEGSEASVLQGCKKTFERSREIAAYITTYHKGNDEKTLLKYVSDFSYEFSSGYMVNLYEKNIQPPYFRKGVIRCYKNKG